MRERFRYRGDSLWWFTELYLHKMRRLDTAVAVVLGLDAAIAAHAPSRLAIASADPVVRDAAIALGAARRVPIDAGGGAARRRARAWPSYLVGLTARLSRLRPSRPPSIARRPAVAAFVHTAFWRHTAAADRRAHPESYIGPVLDAIGGQAGADALFCVGVGPRRNFRARKWWDPITSTHDSPVVPIETLAPGRALRGALDLWARRRDLASDVIAGEGIRAAALFRGVDLWAVLRRELEGAALLQWPWSARAMDEAGAALDALAPDVALTYAEAGGWGRALILEARRRGIRSAGVQHGFIYRHWLNYRHEADEMLPLGSDRGFPAPDRTLAFDGFAADHLRDGTRLPAASIVVTGSPRLDDLAATIGRIDDGERARTRAAFGTLDDGRLLVLAAKASELGEELPALVAAVAARPAVRLVIKTHPAETPAPYEAVARGAGNVTIVGGSADLARLIAAADGVVTRNSTVAIDAMALGVPGLVIGLPSNLSPFVDAGVMLGAASPPDIGARIEALLYDQESRRTQARAAGTFIHRNAMRPDGCAAARAAAAVLALRDGPDGPDRAIDRTANSR
jgi:hypothetical protein